MGLFIYLFLAQKKKASTTTIDDDQGDSLPGESLLPAKSFSFERDLLRILAEIRFINAEVNKLHSLNNLPFKFVSFSFVLCIILHINLKALEF